MTEKQLNLLKFIQATIAHSGKAPTFKSMRFVMGVTSNQAVDDCLSILEREGYILRIGSIRREIMLTTKGTSKNDPSLMLSPDENTRIKQYLETELLIISGAGTVSTFNSILAQALSTIPANMQTVKLNPFIEERSEGTS